MADKDKRTFFARLSNSLITSPLNGKKFLPLDAVRKEVTLANVAAELPSRVSTKLPARVQKVFKSDTHDRIIRDAMKLFAVLVLMGKPEAIKALLNEGATDEDLPFRRADHESSDFTLLSARNRTFNSFSQWERAGSIETFIGKQWIVLAPVVHANGKHLKLDSEVALPFPQSKEVSGGAFSYVHKCKLHPAHQDGFRIEDGKDQVAVKQYKMHSKFIKDKSNAFGREMKMLEQLSALNHRHMIRHRASFEINNDYYVIFDWADGGDLWQYWESHGSSNVSEAWVFQQSLGLTEALAAAHRMKIRHGDLKPGNILLFNVEEDPTLVIGDVGISKYHKDDTFLRKGQTTTSATTPSYQAPEVYGDPMAPRSRAYDVWSMGCIFLEFAVWYLYGFDAVLAFQSARSGVASDNCSYFYKPLDDGTVAVHPKVTEAISNLQDDDRCAPDSPFGRLIAMISTGLLRLSAEERTKAEDVVIELRDIVKSINSHASKTSSRVVRQKPLIFQRQQNGKSFVNHSPKDSVMETALINTSND